MAAARDGWGCDACSQWLELDSVDAREEHVGGCEGSGWREKARVVPGAAVRVMEEGRASAEREDE